MSRSGSGWHQSGGALALWSQSEKSPEPSNEQMPIAVLLLA
jgi:hypothetical protein